VIGPRYLILLSPDPGEVSARAEQVANASGLKVGVLTARMAILVGRSEHCVALETGEGAFIGHVFTNEAIPARVRSISPGSSHAIIASGGQSALDRYWGGYVLATDDRHHDRVAVARDPSGALPCYRAVSGTLTLFASDLRTLAASGLYEPVIDEPRLLRHMAFFDICVPETCMSGLDELLPGTRYEGRGGETRISASWSPWHFTGDPLDEPVEMLAARLKDVVDRCVGAWASCCSGALVALSGGLDSSVVTSALCKSSARLSGFTMVGDDADGDERDYALRVTRHLGIELFEAPYDAGLVDLARPAAPHLPRPVGIAAMQPLGAAARRFAHETGADAYFNGLGGDSIFCWMRSALAVADSVKAGRSPGAALATARDVASLAEESLFAVLRQAGRMLVRGRRALRTDGVGRYLSVGAWTDMAPFSPPPWLSPPDGVLPGRAHHVAMIARIHSFLGGFDRWETYASVDVLFSQPILELCLRIPSWRWVAGGRDRSVARLAFASALPRAIVERRSKGGPDTMLVALCLDRLDQLRALLLDGELARRGMLDLSVLDEALTRASLVRKGHYHELLLLADMEAWVNHWSSAVTGFSRPRDSAP